MEYFNRLLDCEESREVLPVLKPPKLRGRRFRGPMASLARSAFCRTTLPASAPLPPPSTPLDRFTEMGQCGMALT